MNHRTPVATLLAAGLITVALTQTTPSLAQTADAHALDRPSPVGQALDRFRADADSPLRVHRDTEGAVDLVRSPDGSTLVSANAGARDRPRAAAREYIERYGKAFHIDGTTSTADHLSTLPATTGGSVVRAEQSVDGLPVFGGELVMSLDLRGGLVSVAGATTSATSAGSVVVTADRARRTALSITAKAHRLKTQALNATDAGKWLYDPTLVGATDAIGPRPVWRFEVTDGAGVRELVLIDATRGSVALHFGQSEGLKRAVCDRNSLATSSSVPTCSTPNRGEATGPTGLPDVDNAFDNIGKSSEFYQQVAGLNLGELIGTGTAGSRTLQSWVRWCFYGEPCPMDNAFWDGYHMVLGEGFAAADDVVAHELTHGVIDATSKLFYMHQSGAISEHLADVIGELTDQRSAAPGEDDTTWELGEDVPGGAIRSMKDPTLFGQPDAMTSPNYGDATVMDDSGAVHQNSGVGNKAAYLISQGGTFNGVTVTGIDTGDPMVTKTATLYGEVIKRLTSGAEYADLGRTLITTCKELATTGAAGFATGDCDSVSSAVTATEMALPPADPSAAAAEVPATCPEDLVKVPLYRDDDGVVGNTWNIGTLWTRAPNTNWGVPGYANSGKSSWFAYDPNPQGYGDPASSSLWSTSEVAIPVGQPTYLHFHHAHVLEWYDATATDPARYPDGATVLMYTPTSYGWGYNSTPLNWVNGPDKTIQVSPTASPWQGFGGDSHGYGSSRVDLTPLGGQSVRPQWRIVGDASGSFMGWFVDDIEVYTCRSALPTAPRTVAAAGSLGGATVTWTEPDWAGAGISGYRVRRSDGLVRDVPATARSKTFTSLPLARSVSFTVTALNAAGGASPGVTTAVQRTALSAKAGATRVQKTYEFRLSGRLTQASTTTGVPAQTVQFQRRAVNGTTWKTLVTAKTRSDGTVSARLVAYRTAYYRLLFTGANGWVGNRSSGIKVTAY